MACCGDNAENMAPTLTGVTHAKTEVTSFITVVAVLEPSALPLSKVKTQKTSISLPFPPVLEKTVLRI